MGQTEPLSPWELSDCKANGDVPEYSVFVGICRYAINAFHLDLAPPRGLHLFT